MYELMLSYGTKEKKEKTLPKLQKKKEKNNFKHSRTFSSRDN
jgi:hypothetical protein